MILTCLECKTQKRFNVNNQHKLWTERPEAWYPVPAGLPCIPKMPETETVKSDPIDNAGRPVTTICFSTPKDKKLTTSLPCDNINPKSKSLVESQSTKQGIGNISITTDSLEHSCDINTNYKTGTKTANTRVTSTGD